MIQRLNVKGVRIQIEDFIFTDQKWSVDKIGGNIWGHTGSEECQVIYSQGQVDKLQDEGRWEHSGEFHLLQVIVNDLKALGEKINDDDVSHRFLMYLPLNMVSKKCMTMIEKLFVISIFSSLR